MISHELPKTLEEAIDILCKKILDNKVISQLKEIRDEISLYNFSRVYGMKIRNELALDGSNIQLLQDCKINSVYKDSDVNLNSDIATMIIINKLWEKVKEN